MRENRFPSPVFHYRRCGLMHCAYCTVQACTAEIKDTPEFCPRREAAAALEEAEKIRSTDSGVGKITGVAKSVETDGYRVWPRVRELIEFSHRMEWVRLGIAFCVGLKEETRQLTKILESHGFEPFAVQCTIDGGCNPIGQAFVLNRKDRELNIIMGLCIGHDILFSRFSQAPVTTLVVKDRAMCHNPAAPLINRYWRDTFIRKG